MRPGITLSLPPNTPRNGRVKAPMSGSSREPSPAKRGPWYPVVFPNKCDGCQGLATPRCIEFCPHGVFTIVDGKAVVANPQNCIDGCVACRPLCPRGAIEFPQDLGFMKRDKAWTEGLKQRTCRKCGRIFWTDSDRDTCWDCSAKVYADGSRQDQRGSPQR